MTLINWLRRKLNNFHSPLRSPIKNRVRRQPDYHKRKQRLNRANPTVADSKPHPSAQPDKQPQPVQFDDAKSAPVTPVKAATSSIEHQVKSQVVIFYLDENDHEIRPADILNGVSGERIDFRFPSFDQYYVTAIDDFTSHFEDDDQEITVHYELKQGKPVFVNTIDTDTGAVLNSIKVLTNKLGTNYEATPPTIPNYRLISRLGQSLGSFSNRIQHIVFAYRKADWQTVQAVEYYVKLTAHHDVFDAPNGTPLRTGLPQNLVIKIFGRVTTTDGQDWLNIGGFEWIQNKQLQPSDPPTHPVAGLITKTSRNPVRLFGTISFIPGQTIATYRKPYGDQVGTLTDGSRISIVATIVDDQNLIWYELPDHSVLPRNYVNVDEPT
ncbi:hypothetical protein YK48G_21730 [Lentilactobacillus fungorum]|uniref:MucBP domain-containing protein n=1 Tax=Lentilactobacillus fungorum TaxID=2201250 RepID=A0ABQ3W0Q1_9LACO|nr:MucBP domain-containing protein [Lentilactobacillus fungorum]GHP14748.1 hypothetical protein YK48G_21730 [Lentilactobacillus fungorum]